MIAYLQKSISILISGTVLACLVGLPAQAQSEDTLTASQSPQPNIVFIFADDLGYGDIGVFGADDIKTPNIDSIAAQGVIFPEFYSASPVCSPSRAALLTGRYPIRMGIHEVFFPGSYTGMPEAEITIAEMLRDAGYSTAAVGKWHLGHHTQFLPLNQGFDEFFGIPYSNDMSPLPMMRGNAYIERQIDQTQLTRRLTDEAVAFIERQDATPFFLYIPHPMPHIPLYRSEAFEGVSERGLYGDVIEELDASVGEIIAALERAGRLENTLLVFSSDNGPWIFMGDHGGSPGDLRNGKGTTFEGGVRVPTVAMFPGTITPGSVYDAPASMLDWLPTIADFAAAASPTDRPLDGENIAPALRGDTPANAERTLAHYSHGQLEAIRVGDWKLKRPYDDSIVPIPGPVKAFLDGEVGLRAHNTLLFDLAEDPGETRNLASKAADKVAELETALVQFETELGDTPPSITQFSLTIDQPVRVMLGAVFKLGALILGGLLILVATLAYFAGRHLGRKSGRSQHADTPSA